MDALRRNTLINHVYGLFTDFIWLSAEDIEKMVYLSGFQTGETSIIRVVLLKLYKRGRLIRRGQRGSYQYMKPRRNKGKP